MMYTQVYDPMTNTISEAMILRDEDNAYIPFDNSNRDYQEYLVWLAEGNTPNPPKGEPVVPIEPIPPPDINEVNAQVQDIDSRVSKLEDQFADVQTMAAELRRLTIDSGERHA